MIPKVGRLAVVAVSHRTCGDRDVTVARTAAQHDLGTPRIRREPTAGYLFATSDLTASAHSLDDLAGLGDHLLGDRQAERLGRLAVDHQLEMVPLLDRARDSSGSMVERRGSWNECLTALLEQKGIRLLHRLW